MRFTKIKHTIHGVSLAESIVYLFTVNDQMISTRSKTKAEAVSDLKNHNTCQNRHHIKCKTFPKSIQDSHHTSGNKCSKETDNGKLDPRARARLVKGDPSRRTHLQEDDQHPVRSKVKQ